MSENAIVPRRGLRVIQPELDRDVRRGSSLGGIDEVARMLGVSRGAVCNWRVRHAGMPSPLVELASGLVWDLSDVANWHRRGEA